MSPPHSELVKQCDRYRSLIESKGYNGCGDLHPADVLNFCGVYPNLCEGNLNLERCELPQLPDNRGTLDAWALRAKQHGILITRENFSRAEFVALKPSEKFVSLCEVCSIASDMNKCFRDSLLPNNSVCKDHAGCFCAWESGVQALESGHIIDGHHRWAAIAAFDDSLSLDPLTFTVDVYKSLSGDVITIKDVEKLARDPQVKDSGLLTHSDCAHEY